MKALFRTFALILSAAFAASPAEATDTAPASKEELATRIESYQSTQNCGGMLDLFYTQGVDAARQKAFTDAIKTLYCTNMVRPITSVAFQDIPADKIKKPHDFENSPSEYTLKPLGAIVIDFGAPTLREKIRSVSFLYGTHDHKFYLIATKAAGS